MEAVILPPVRHLLPLATIRRARRLSMPGTITVRVNERVEANDIVAEAEGTPRHVFLDLVRGLGVPEEQVPRYVVRERGERVEAGDILAGPVGFARRTIRAPADGRVAGLLRGRLLFEIRGEPEQVTAGVPGVVLSTDGSREVVIETSGALIEGAWGNGREAFGVLRVLTSSPEERLDTHHLDISYRGAVLVAGRCDHPAPLHQAAELAVRGLVLGGLTADLGPVVQRLSYPVVVLEGFGPVPMNQAAFDLLRSNAGRDAAVDGRVGGAYEAQRPTVIVPLPASREADLPEDVIPLAPGVRVHLTRAPRQGQVGVVRQVLRSAVRYPSGLMARSVEVDLESGETVTVPLANLEILQ